MDSERFVTVGVPCYNCADRIQRTVASILANNHTQYELILAEGGSTDDTVAVLNALAAQDPRIRVLTGLAKDVCGKRNAVLAEAASDLLVFCDDDIIVDPGWIGAYVRAAADWPSMMSGPLFPAAPGPATGIRKWTQPILWKPTFLNRVMVWRVVVGGNFACPAPLARAVGGWDPDYFMDEEADFALRVLRSGKAILSVPEARGTHPPRPDWDDYVQKRHCYARADMYLMSRKYGRTLHGWGTIGLFLTVWTGMVVLDALRFQGQRVRMSWERLIGGLAGLFNRGDWAEHERAMARRQARRLPRKAPSEGNSP